MFIGYIYKITGSCGKVYIGSTINCKTRFNDHRYNKKNHSFSRLLEKPLVFEIIRQDQYILTRTMHLVEQYYINNAINCVNKMRAYRNQNKNKIKEDKKNYYEKNKEEIKKQRKEYNILHKNKIKEDKKNYYEKNKEKIKERYKNKKKIECKFCKTLIIKNMSKHQRTRKCLAIQGSIFLKKSNIY